MSRSVVPYSGGNPYAHAYGLGLMGAALATPALDYVFSRKRRAPGAYYGPYPSAYNSSGLSSRDANLFAKAQPPPSYRFNVRYSPRFMRPVGWSYRRRRRFVRRVTRRYRRRY